MLETCFNEYYGLSDAKRSKIDPKYDPINLFLQKYSYDDWLENEELTDTTKSDLPPMTPLEGDEEEFI